MQRLADGLRFEGRHARTVPVRSDADARRAAPARAAVVTHTQRTLQRAGQTYAEAEAAEAIGLADRR